MRDYHSEAASLRRQAATLSDDNPVKLCVQILACVAECYAAAQTFEMQAIALPAGEERQFQVGAAQAARVAGDRLLLSSAAPIRGLLAARADQNAALIHMIDALTDHMNLN